MKINSGMKTRIFISIVLIVLLGVVLMITSCVKDEVYVGPASISNVEISPSTPLSTDAVTISVKIRDLKGVQSAKLFYKVFGAATYTETAMTAGADNVYSGTIPAQPMDTKVEYYVLAVNQDNINAYFPANAPALASSYTVGASTIVKIFINEVFPDGTKDATNPDWVEVYNDSEIPVDISGYAFYDDGIKTGNKAKRILESGLVIPAKGFLVLKAETYENLYTVEFGLSTSGDAVYLENKEGVVVAELDFNGISTAGKKSYGRKPDGSNNLQIFNNATRGTSNNNAD
jgi:hypothetical protein